MISSRFEDDWLREGLARRLWGYPKLVDSALKSGLADVRRQVVEEREKMLRRTSAQPITPQSGVIQDAVVDQREDLTDRGGIILDLNRPTSHSHGEQASLYHVDLDPDGSFQPCVDSHCGPGVHTVDNSG